MSSLGTDEGRPTANLRLRRIARASAWALLATVAIMVISGWGITQTGVIHRMTFGLVDRRLADAVHRGANIPLALFFLLHVMINIRLDVKTRRRTVARVVNGILVVAGILIMSFVVYMEYFRLGG